MLAQTPANAIAILKSTGGQWIKNQTTKSVMQHSTYNNLTTDLQLPYNDFCLVTFIKAFFG
jgi:hypothetical protein